jgi:hypothetical protein
MSEQVAFCSANDRPVPVTLRMGGDPARDDPHELVCLEYGRRCTGAFCPLLSTTDEESLEPAALVARGRAPLPGAP